MKLEIWWESDQENLRGLRCYSVKLFQDSPLPLEN